MKNADLSFLQLLDVKWTVSYKSKKYTVDSFTAGLCLAEDLCRAHRKSFASELTGRCTAYVSCTTIPLFGTHAQIEIEVRLFDNEINTKITIL